MISSEWSTLYPATRDYLAELLRTAEVDYKAFERPLQRCELSRCRGTCCHDGVYLTGHEATHLRSFVDEHREKLDSMVSDLPEQVIVYGRSANHRGPKTATRAFPMATMAESYPAHFPNTNCVFLDSEARCSLQRLSVDQGLGPWFAKPFTCWMHPISLIRSDREDGPATLTLHDDQTDPQRDSETGYDGFICRTHCGRTEPKGEPAHVVLIDELRALGKISGRDFVAEFEAG